MTNDYPVLGVYTRAKAPGLQVGEDGLLRIRSTFLALMHNQINWTLAACSRILRPVVRLILAMGLKHPQIEGLLRELLLDEARRLWLARGVAQPNISQLAVTTGLNRKDVTARVRVLDIPPPFAGLSPAASVFTVWLQLAARNPERRRLPIKAVARGPSFEALARQASKGNVHHRAVLDDLIRLGMVVEHEGQVELAADGFVPARDLQSMLGFLGENTRDHLQAAVSNTLGGAQPMLERSVYADGLTHEECERLHALTRKRWDALHHSLVNEMTEAVERSGAQGTQRMKVGIYVLYEDVEESPTGQPAPVATRTPAKKRARP